MILKLYGINYIYNVLCKIYKFVYEIYIICFI